MGRKKQPAGLSRKTRAAKRPPNFSASRTLKLHHVAAPACLRDDVGDNVANAIVDGSLSVIFKYTTGWLKTDASLQLAVKGLENPQRNQSVK